MLELSLKHGRCFYLLTVFVMVMGILSVGCDSSDSAGGGQTGSGWAGHYSGSWTDAGGNVTGTWSFDATSGGALSGLFSRDGFDGKGLVGSGSIDSGGGFTFSCTGALNLTMTGTIVESQTGGRIVASIEISGDVTGSGQGRSMVWFAVVADPRYYDTALGTSGDDYQNWVENDNTMPAQNEAIVDAGIDDILTQKPQFVIMIGDLTTGGSMASHQKFIQAINRFRVNGIQVYVTPGGRDIDSPRAYEYIGNDRSHVPNLGKEAFVGLYADFGYNQAISRDTDTLSYVVEPVEGLWLMSLDTPYHGSGPLRDTKDSDFSYEGEISDTTMAWIKARLAEAESSGKVVIAASHHGLTEHFQGQFQFYPESVIYDWENVPTELRRSGLSLVFTGGFHANDITLEQIAPQAGGPDGYQMFYDVETASLTGYPCAYRTVGLSLETGLTMIRSYHVQDIDYDLGGADFQDYAHDFLEAQLTNLLEDMLYWDFGFSDVVSAQIAPAGVETLIAHYVGDEVMGTEMRNTILGYAADPDLETYALVLGSVWTDIHPGDNEETFDIFDILFF